MKTDGESEKGDDLGARLVIHTLGQIEAPEVHFLYSLPDSFREMFKITNGSDEIWSTGAKCRSSAPASR